MIFRGDPGQFQSNGVHYLPSVELLRNSVSDDEMVGQISRVLLVLDQIITDTQTMIFDLSPPVLSLLGLGPAVEWLADRTQEEHGLTAVATHGGKPVPLADDVRILLFQAVKELLTNVVKHSGSATARVSNRRTKRTVRVLVEDAGVGMAQTEIESMDGFGLFSIHERLLDLGGRRKIASTPGATRVLLVAPLALEGDTGGRVPRLRRQLIESTPRAAVRAGESSHMLSSAFFTRTGYSPICSRLITMPPGGVAWILRSGCLSSE